jgi:hypothetical protein
MPAIVSAAVLRWAVDRDRQPPIVNFVGRKTVSLYAADGNESGDVSGIIGQYILDSPQAQHAALLQAARDGLLQVIEVKRTNVTPPAVPPLAP